jgi:transposase, IS6 family
MSAVGKLGLAFNILEHVIKTATCFLVDPNHPGLSHSDIANKMQIGQRIEILEKHCVEKLSPEERDRVNVMLNRVNDLRDMRNFPAHYLVYSSGDGEFHFHKYAERLESQVGTPEEMMAKVKQLQTWTAEFAEVLQLCRTDLINWAAMVLESSVAGLFKWRQFEPEMILLAVGWYLRFSLSYRDVEELLAERGLLVDHVTVWRWVQRYAPQIQRRLRPRLRPTNDSWRVDETYIRVKGKWVYLYRAVDSSDATIDFLLSAKRDAAAAERFLAKALGGANHPAPRVITTDEHAGYPPAIERLKAEGALKENCQHRPVQYLNNVLEQDHRASNVGCAQANIFVHSGELGVRSPVMKRFI